MKQKIQDSRCRLMKNNPYYALMLMYFRFIAVPGMQKISTNGRCIYFNPDFLEKLYDREMDYILCHQVLHVVSGQLWKAEKSEDRDFHFACNMIVNSELKEQGLLPERTTHFSQLNSIIPGTGMEGRDYSPEGILYHLLFRPSRFDEKTKSRYMEDSDVWWNRRDDCGNSGIMILDRPENDPIVGFPDHERKEEEKEEKEKGKGKKDLSPKGGKGGGKPKEKKDGELQSGKASEQDAVQKDNSEKNRKTDEANTPLIWELRSKLVKNFVADPDKSAGRINGSVNVPGFLQRMYEIRQKARIDWRQLLNDFIQEQVADYSFSPPDRRFQDTGFFLPDLNEKEFVAREILFMVDTSGSVHEAALSQVYAEICGACEQFQGKLLGRLGFFDAEVTAPIPFENVDDVLSIVPYGGGGTDFSSIFRYLRAVNNEIFPSCIVIFTDGFGNYPDENDTMGIPIMWILDNEESDPPFGKVIRYPVEKGHHKKRSLISYPT